MLPERTFVIFSSAAQRDLRAALDALSLRRSAAASR
jgi:hypothetical protein